VRERESATEEAKRVRTRRVYEEEREREREREKGKEKGRNNRRSMTELPAVFSVRPPVFTAQ